MLAVTLVTIAVLLIGGPARAQLYPSSPPLLGPIQKDAYVPGLNADATGRSFYWQAPDPSQRGPDPTLQPHVNAYGFGQSADQYGRPIQPRFPGLHDGPFGAPQGSNSHRPQSLEPDSGGGR